MIPHLSRDKAHFSRGRLETPPSMKMDVSLIAESYSALVHTLNDSANRPVNCIHTTADTGAQTCPSGPELLEFLRCTDNRLGPISHRIRGITNVQLNIKGVFFMDIKVSFGELNLCVRKHIWVLPFRLGIKRKIHHNLPKLIVCMFPKKHGPR